MTKGAPRTLAKATPASTAKRGMVKKAAAVPNVAAYVAPAAGAVAVVSNAADDLTTLAAAHAVLRTSYLDLLAKLRTAGVLAT